MRAARVSALVTVATLAASCSTALVQPAGALEPGVQVNPGSPAAKEYVLPVGQARRTGSERERARSSPAQESSEAASEPLFGAGITPPGGGGRDGGRRPGGSAAAVGVGAGHAHPGAAATQPPPALVRRVADGHGSSGGGSSELVLLAGGVAVLALGAFAGVVLRHSRRPTSAS